MSGPYKIYPTLFLGDLAAANNVDKLYDLGISHVLSVGAGTPTYIQFPRLMAEKEVTKPDDDISYLQVTVLDMEDQNILKHFEPTYKFIEKGRNAGACLVHCNAGVSRSATIVIAYIMKKFKLSLQDATETVSDVCPQICPNPGFVRQLEQYYLNLHPELKKSAPVAFKAEPPAQELPKVEEISIAPVAIESAPVATSSQEEVTPSSTEQNTKEIQEKVMYGCRTCRRPLFVMDDLMPHQTGKHSIPYHKRDKGAAVAADQAVCSSYFLQEPLQWMGNVDENEGKIACPKCHSRVGFWKWDGLQCSCGTWVTPAIQIAKNRVDERMTTVPIPVPGE